MGDWADEWATVGLSPEQAWTNARRAVAAHDQPGSEHIHEVATIKTEARIVLLLFWRTEKRSLMMRARVASVLLCFVGRFFSGCDRLVGSLVQEFSTVPDDSPEECVGAELGGGCIHSASFERGVAELRGQRVADLAKLLHLLHTFARCCSSARRPFRELLARVAAHIMSSVETCAGSTDPTKALGVHIRCSERRRHLDEDYNAMVVNTAMQAKRSRTPGIFVKALGGDSFSGQASRWQVEDMLESASFISFAGAQHRLDHGRRALRQPRRGVIGQGGRESLDGSCCLVPATGLGKPATRWGSLARISQAIGKIEVPRVLFLRSDSWYHLVSFGTFRYLSVPYGTKRYQLVPCQFADLFV